MNPCTRRTASHLAISVILLCAGTLLSSAQPGLIQTRTVAPGVTHSEYLLPGPNTLDVLAVSLTNPFIGLESYKPDGLTRTTVQAAANDREAHRVIGAINADFFSFETGWPVGNQVVNGTWALGVSSQRSHLAIDTAGKAFIERLAFSGQVWAANGSSFPIAGVNTARGAGTIVCYTPFRGAATGTDGTGAECALSILDPTVTAGDTMRAVVRSIVSGGNTAISAGAVVLSGASGSPASFLSSNAQAGDTIRLLLGFNHPLRAITQVLGGAGRFLLGGRNVTDSMSSYEGITSAFTGVRHPRTFVGFNRDTTTLFLCTVDGRQTTSIGMTFGEMADFLLSIGAWDAFNFDGGGSTTMIVRGAIVNSPSDPAGERSVANTLQVVSTAPTGSLFRLHMEPRSADVFQGGTQQFTASGFDEYENPLPLPPDIVWQADPQIGTISATGLFTAVRTNDSGWVRVRWNAVADSAFVVVRLLSRLHVYPSPLVMVPGERVTLLVRAGDSDGRRITLDNSRAMFTPDAPGITVDAAGLVTARDFGSGTLTVGLDTLRAVLPFNFSGNDTTVTVERFADLFAWDATTVGLDTAWVPVGLSGDPLVPDTPAVRIAYSFPSSPATLFLNTFIPLSGRIDSLSVRVYGSGNGDTVRFLVRDKDGDTFLVTPTGPVSWKDEWRTLGVTMSRAIPLVPAALDYPVTLTGIKIDFGNLLEVGGTVAGVIYIDDLCAHYPLRTVAPQVLFNFESGVSGWLTPASSNAAQLIGINRTASTLSASSERAYEGSYSGKWVFVDDAGSAADWDIRMTRGQNSDLGSMLRGSYVGAWVYAEGETQTELQIVIRDGAGLICAGPRFPVRHHGWKLIGTRLDEGLFTPYLTSGRITDAGNKFNGFRLRGPNAVLQGSTRTIYIDKLVTSALTVPTGFVTFSAEWTPPIARLHWSVNSEISINRYAVERGTGGLFEEIGSVQGRGNIDTTVHYEFVDTPPSGPGTLYRIRQITNDGGQELSQVLTPTPTGTGDTHGAIPLRYELLQNYPNPFNPRTTIRYAVGAWTPEAASHGTGAATQGNGPAPGGTSGAGSERIRLVVYDLLGREVAVLVDGMMHAGSHEVVFDGSNLASGVYVYRIDAGTLHGGDSRFTGIRKMICLK